jgi:Peptidase family M23
MNLLPKGRRRWMVRTAVAAAAAGTAVTALTPPATADTRGAARTDDVRVQYAAACPAAGNISQEWHAGHDGIDIANGYGTPIYSVGPGVVIFSATADPGGYGQYINIRHDDNTVTQYGHMRRRLVSTGQRVTAGQQIAEMGSEGSSTGPHLHLRTYPRPTATGRGINPRDYLRARGVTLPCRPGGNPQPTNFTTWGTSVRVRQSPSTSAGVVHTFGGPTRVRVKCQKHAQLVEAEGYRNDAWSYLEYPVRGWMTNIYIDHPAAWLPGIPTCP